MKASVKARFIKALRSGKYKQGFGTMRDSNDKFCVLGVLCNLHAQEHPVIAKKQKYKTEYLGDSASLPMVVQTWAGLSSDNPKLPGVKGQPTLMHLNDSKRLTFPEIATLIEFSDL